MTLQFHFTEIT